MASWKKVIVSGSKAILAEVTASAGFSGDGSNLTGITAGAVAWSAVTSKPTVVSGSAQILSGSTALSGSGNTAITTVGTVTAGTWQGTTVAVDQGGTGATSLNDLITMGTHTTGNYVATVTGGTGITSTGNTTGESIAHSLSVDASQTQITGVGTIGTGVWNGTAVASAYLDADTAHLTTDQTFSGKKTFSAPITASANISSSGNITAVSMSGDGSGLTNIAADTFDIDGLTAFSGVPHATQDEFLISDNGTELRADMTMVANGAFALVSGDAAIAAGGALTIAATSVEGSMLNTNVISGQSEMTGDVADTDEIMVSDAGTVKRADFSVVRDAVFADVSGDAAIAAGGALTIGANTVEGSMLNSNTAGTGLTYAGSNLDVDLSGESAVTIGAASSTVTIGQKMIITGDLEIRGTHTAVSSSNLLVADQFALFNSGSTSGDGGIVVQTGASGVGTAFAFDDSAVRWGVSEADGTAHDATAFVPRQYVVTVSASAADPSTNPANFGNSAATRAGLMHVRTDTGDVWIYS
jgi:hypothetical protein